MGKSDIKDGVLKRKIKMKKEVKSDIKVVKKAKINKS